MPKILRCLRSLILVCLTLSFLGCMRHREVECSSPPTSKTVGRAVTSTHRLHVEGRINLNLHMNGSRPRVQLKGDPVDLTYLRTEVSNDVLKIYFAKDGYKACQPVTIDVYGPYLTELDYQGVGKIIGKSLRGKRLFLNIDNAGTTTLSGTIHLQKLQASGGGNVQINGIKSMYLQLELQDNTRARLQGTLHLATLNVGQNTFLSMYWIKSPYLTIRAKDNAVVRLAGAVDRLDVELCNHAHFDGRYLRAERPYVKTHDQSVAIMVATKHQHTLATGASDIYFYNLPTTKTDFMADNGSVLDMRDWNNPEIQEYTRYNKPGYSE